MYAMKLVKRSFPLGMAMISDAIFRGMVFAGIVGVLAALLAL